MSTTVLNIIKKCSPSIRLNESLSAATKTRREAFKADHYINPIDGFGVYHAIAPTDALARIKTGNPVKRLAVACSAVVAATAQLCTHLATGPLLGAYVLAVWLCRGKERALDSAAKHLLPIIIFAHAAQITAVLGCLLGAAFLLA